MASSSGNVDVTPEELERISKALKDEKFRQLFCEYAQEISDPENRKKYEEEIAQLEKNRGTNVVFVHPEPGYVIKTNVDGERKAFINVCKSDKVGQPTSTDVRRESGQVGAQWSIPHSLAPGREDIDKGGMKCTVYDCTFHPDCFKHAERDKRFFALMDDTAMNSIETNFSVKLDRENKKKLTKLKFKGQPRPAVIRTKSKSGSSGDTDAWKDFNVDYPYKDIDQKDNDGDTSLAKSSMKISGTRNTKSTPSKNDTSGPVEPKYSIVHRGHFDMQHFTNAPDSMPTTRPQELIIKIQLPLLKSIATVQLDVFEKQILLECHKPASYKLDLTLPYAVDESKGNAKFDKSKSCLTITLPVLPPEIPKLPSFAPETRNAPLVEEISQSSSLTEDSGEHIEPGGETMPAAIENETESVEQANGEVSSENAKSNPITDSIAIESVQTEDAQIRDVQRKEIIEPVQNGFMETTHTSKASLSDEPTASENEACPSYIFRQDDLTVTFVLQVADIDSSSLTKHISDDKSTASVKFRSITNENGATHDEVPYSFCVVFGSQCQVEDMDIDVQTTEAVLLLHKAEMFHGEWSGFKAGVSLAGLEEKLFLTEENVREHLDTMTKKRKGKHRASSGSSSDVDCGVIEASEDKLVIELESKVNGDAPGEITDATLGALADTVVDTVIDAVIGEVSNTAASLSLDPKHDDLSPTSDVSCPSTPCSPSGLRSAMRDNHHGYREHRSVSFSEDVVVETVVSSSSPRKAKGKNKRHQPPRPRRFITKLRDGSQNQGTYSDSEVHFRARGEGRKEEGEDDEEIFSEEVVFPDWVCLDRQTSSDSSGGETGTTAYEFSNKKKKPKANKRQRRQMTDAKRARAFDDDNSGMQDAWFGPQYPLRATSSEGSLPSPGSHTKNPNSGKRPPKKDQHHDQSKKQVDNRAASKTEDETRNDKDEQNSLDIQDDGDSDKTASNMKSETKHETGKDKCGEEKIAHELQLNNTQEQSASKTDSETAEVIANVTDENIPLEMQDHRTESAVTFTNKVMFELDE